MNELPWKNFSQEEIEAALQSALDNPNGTDDWIVDPYLCIAGPLYSRLWFLSCGASRLARNYIESQNQPEKELFLQAFNSCGGIYAGKTLLNFALEIDEIENLTKEMEMIFVQAVFERIIAAINEELFPENHPYPLKYFI